MNKKKIFLTVLALILVCCISVAGTLAYMIASQSNDKAVVNTFVAAGGGKIIDDTTPEAPVVPNPNDDPDDDSDDTIELNNGFFLVESTAVYASANYTLDQSNKVIANTYDKVVPSMEILKDPKLTVNLVDGVDAYIFVKVVNSTGNNLTYGIDSGNWTVLDATNYPGVYVYKGAIQTGTTDVELNAVGILTENKVTAAASLTDADAVNEGMQLGELKFEAYACQAGGFANAAAAYAACFDTTTTD